jgi:hypothetical protein
MNFIIGQEEELIRKPRNIISIFGMPVYPGSNINPNTKKRYPDRRGRKQGRAYGQIPIQNIKS